MKNSKGIILAGGKGTRLHPLTKAYSKHLLPIYDKPMIYYSLAILMKFGLREIAIITTSKDKKNYLRLLGDGSKYGLNISYFIQNQPKGIAEAFIICDKFIDGDNVFLILGDNVFLDFENSLSKTITESKVHRGASIFLKKVNNPKSFGVAKFDKKGNVIEIIEKPSRAPSKMAVTGLYSYDEYVSEYAKSLKPSARGELEITDINNIYLDKGQLNSLNVNENIEWFDAGTFDNLLLASKKVQKYQNQNEIIFSSPEIIGFENGWIDLNQLKVLSSEQNSSYGKAIMEYINHSCEN